MTSPWTYILIAAAALHAGAAGAQESPVMSMRGPEATEVREMMGREIFPIGADLSMADFIWRSEPAVACSAARSAATNADTAVTHIETLRAKITRDGGNIAEFETVFSGMPDMKAMTSYAVGKFCDRPAPAKLSAQDKALYDEGVVILRAVASTLSEATAIQLMGDKERACAELETTAARLAELKTFMARAVQASPAMAETLSGTDKSFFGGLLRTAELGIESCGGA